ncbi:MAG: hypothetical protein A2020_09800 [Lentisphaerae bacterium GWF2_45_14]|nr:MAG: hypothetical protein A2020_09800 [Lentisphaerae bacterium GWF2_45_14]
MKSTLDCIPCFVEHALHVAKMVTDDTEKQLYIVKETLAKIVSLEMEQTPPEMARTIHSIIRNITGVEDAYSSVKFKSTEFALELLPRLEKYVEDANDEFEARVRLTIAGNIIDFGADIHFSLDNAEERILEVMNMPIGIDAVRTLKRAMELAPDILYIADNCGEAVFDSLLISPYKEKTTLAVRGFPILNDITIKEVKHSGLDKLPKSIIDTGDATPGVILKYSKPEFVKAFNSASLIIAKGQGNFETLSDTDRPIVFLLRVKCPVVSRLLNNSPKGSLHVIPQNIAL